jgi:hypothetical protein
LLRTSPQIQANQLADVIAAIRRTVGDDGGGPASTVVDLHSAKEQRRVIGDVAV